MNPITPLNIAGIRIDTSFWCRLPEGHPFAGRMDIGAIQAFLVQIAGRNILVDAPSAAFPPEEAGQAVPELALPSLAEQLAALGRPAESIEAVIITHPHFDHINGLTVERDGVLVPLFPNARHYLGTSDWDPADWDDTERDTLGVVHAAGLLTLVESGHDHDLGDGVRLLTTPGESPGHMAVLVGDDLITGDIFHHSLEFEEIDRHVFWADQDAMLTSKKLVASLAADSGGLLYCTHIPDPYLVTHTGGRFVFTPAVE